MPQNESLDREIADLERRLQEKRSQQNQDQESSSFEHSEVHRAVGERFQEQVPDFQPKQPKQVQGEASWENPAIRDQVQELVNIAFTQDPYVAIAKAAETKNPAIIDALHDVLADEFHQELIDRQKLKQAA